MRLTACVALVLCLAASGCFGGCYTSGYRLVWEDDALVPLAAARATPEALANRSVILEPAAAGLPFAAASLPVADGNATLRRVTMAWGGQWPGELTLQRSRDGNVTVRVAYDTGDRKGTVRGHIEDFLAAVSNATEAERAATADDLLSDWDPGSNEVTMFTTVLAPQPLRLGVLFAQRAGPWEALRPGTWTTDDGPWSFESAVTVWRLRLDDFHEEDVAVDAAGAVAGPVLDLNDVERKPPADVPALQALTRGRFVALGLPEPDLAAAQAIPAGKLCID